MARQSLALRRGTGNSAIRPYAPGYISFTGTAGEYLRTTRADLTSVGKVMFAVRFRPTVINVNHRLCGWDSLGAAFNIGTDNKLYIAALNVAIGNIGGAWSSVAIPGFAAGQDIWLRGQLTVANAQCQYWYSTTNTTDVDRVTWSSVGTTQVGTGAATTPALNKTGVVNVGTDDAFNNDPSCVGRIYAFAEYINDVKTLWFTDTDIPTPPDTDFISAGAGQLYTKFGLGASFVPSMTNAGAIRADFSFDEASTGLGPNDLMAVSDVDYSTARITYQPALIPNHPSLGVYKEAVVVRSTAGFPATSLDGATLMRYLNNDPALNEGFASVLDGQLQPRTWYYYCLFVRYDTSSGWFKTAEVSWLNPEDYGYRTRTWENFPEYYRRIDSGIWVYPGFLRRLSNVLGYEFDLNRTWASTIGDVWDFEKISARLLPEAGDALGLTLTPAAIANGDRRLRTLVGNLMALRKKKGTREGTEGYVSAQTGYPTRVYEGLNLLHRLQHAEWPNNFLAQDGSGPATDDNHPGWTTKPTFSGALGQLTRQTASGGEGVGFGVGNTHSMPDGSFYLRNTNNTGGLSAMTMLYGNSSTNVGTHIPVIGGHVYNFACSMKASVSATLVIQVVWMSETGGTVATSTLTGAPTLSTAWQRFVTTAVTAHANAKFAALSIGCSPSIAAGAHINLFKPIFFDTSWRPEGIPTLQSLLPLSSVSSGDANTFVHKDFYEPPREVKLNVYPMRTNLALNSDFVLDNVPPGVWASTDAPTYGQVPIAYSDYADIIDAEPGDSETSYLDMATGLAPLLVATPAITYDTTSGGRLVMTKNATPYGFTVSHTYFEATDLGGMSAAISAYSSVTRRDERQGYLTATVGSVSTPDPGPLPAECVFVWKARGPTVSGGATNHTIASQYDADPQRAWLLRRSETTDNLLWSATTSGNASSGALTRTYSYGAPTGVDEWGAFTYKYDATTEYTSVLRSADGVTYAQTATQTNGKWVPFDATSVVRVGAFGSSEPWDGRIYSVELRTGTSPTGTHDLWTPGYVDFPSTVTGNQVSASYTMPVDASASIRVDCDRPPADGVVHSPLSGNFFLMYLRYTDGDFYFYFYDSTGAPVPIKPTLAQLNAAGIPDTGRWQYKITWDAATDTQSLHGRNPALNLNLMDETNWTLVTSGVQAGKQLRSGTNTQNLNNTTWGGSGKIRRAVMEVNGAIALDYDFRYLRTNVGTTMVLPTGQTATFTKNATSPLVGTPMVDGVVWRFDANDYPGSGTSYTDPRGRTWTLSNGSAITRYLPTSEGVTMTMAFEWYTDDSAGARIVDPLTSQPIRTVSPAYALTTTESRYEIVNAQPPVNALYGKLVLQFTYDTAFTIWMSWALIEDAPFPDEYFNGTFTDGDQGDFYFAKGRNLNTTGALLHQSPSVYYQSFKRLAAGSGGTDALTQLMPYLVPFRRSFKVITAATGLYNAIT